MKGIRRGCGLIFMVLYHHLYSSMAAPSATALQEESLPADSNYQETELTNGYNNNGIANQFGTRYSANLLSHQGYAHGGANGGRDTPHTGGSAVIPVYAAGSAQQRQDRRHNRNAGNCNENNTGLLLAAVLASIAHLCIAF